MKNFLFDLYGTLVDIHTDESSGEVWQSVADMLERGDRETVRDRYAQLCAAEKVLDGGEFDLLKVMQKLVDGFGAECSAERFAINFREASLKKLRVFDGAAQMLDGLRARGAKIYLLSNAQACFTRYELEKLKLSDKFDGIILSSEAGWKKPCVKFFKTAFKKFGLLPEECVYIGNDLRDDIAGARSAGMRSVYIKTEQSGSYPEHIPLDMAVKDHKELASLLYRLAEN